MCLFFFLQICKKLKKYQEGSNTTNWMFMDDFRIFSTRNLSFCSNIYTIKSVPRDIILDDLTKATGSDALAER